MLSETISSPQAVGDRPEEDRRIEGGQDRLGDAEELALAADLLLEGGRLLAEPPRRVGVGHRLRRDARVDLEQPQVVRPELAEAELREHEHAEALVLEQHRREEHRFVEVVLGARDRLGARVGRRVVEQLGDPVLGDPAGDPGAVLDLELLRRLVDVLADAALHGDGQQVLVVEPVDADVVVVDELAELGGDRLADLLDARQAAEPRAELLDRLELGRPRRQLGVVPGGLDRDRRLGRERVHRLELVVGPGVRLVVVRRRGCRAARGCRRRAAARCRPCRSPPGRRRRAGCPSAGRRGSAPRTSAGAR